MELSPGVKPRGVGDRKSAYLRPRSGSFHSMQTSGWGRQGENRRAGWGLSSGGCASGHFRGRRRANLADSGTYLFCLGPFSASGSGTLDIAPSKKRICVPLANYTDLALPDRGASQSSQDEEMLTKRERHLKLGNRYAQSSSNNSTFFQRVAGIGDPGSAH